MKAPLTDLSVRALKAPARGQTTIWDKNSPLGVRVSAGGTKTYIVLVGSGKRKAIGNANILSLKEARDEAKRILAEKTLGLTKKPSAINFDAAVPLFLEDNYKNARGKRTKSEAKRLLENHFVPAFRKRPLSEITDIDISVELAKLSKTPSAQLHAYRAIKVMMRWCTRPPRRYIQHSPLEGYEPPGEDKKRSRILTDAELVKVWTAAADRYGAMIRLLILWGTRSGETARLQRTWVEDGSMMIPGEFTKNGRAHAIPLLPMARAILRAQQTNRACYFPGRLLDDTHFKDGSWGKLKREIDKASGVTGWQIRDLRRTFRSNIAKLRVPREIAELLLNHVTGANKNDLDEIYDRYDYLDEKREALAKWETRLKELLKRP
jgi:integrase